MSFSECFTFSTPSYFGMSQQNSPLTASRSADRALWKRRQCEQTELFIMQQLMLRDAVKRNILAVPRIARIKKVANLENDIASLIPQSHLLYGGRRTPKSSDSCGCRRNSAVATGPPYGESLCFTGRRGGRRIIALSIHFYVRRRNLTRRSHAIDASTATVRRTYGGPASVRRVSLTARSPYGRRTVTVWSPCGRLA